MRIHTYIHTDRHTYTYIYIYIVCVCAGIFIYTYNSKQMDRWIDRQIDNKRTSRQIDGRTDYR